MVAADFACALASKDEATGSHDHYGDAMTLLAAAPSVTAAPPPPVDPLTNAPVSSRSICARVFPDGKASTSDHARAKIRRASEGLQLCRELGLGGPPPPPPPARSGPRRARPPRSGRTCAIGSGSG